MVDRICALERRHFLPLLLLTCASLLYSQAGRADDTVSLLLVMMDRKFEPAELHAPPGRPIAIHIKNLNPIVSEFESNDLHFKKIMPTGSEAVVYVRPQQPGRYNFFDDFHRETQGFLVVP
jgi:Cupredoxin-like domain